MLLSLGEAYGVTSACVLHLLLAGQPEALEMVLYAASHIGEMKVGILLCCLFCSLAAVSSQ